LDLRVYLPGTSLLPTDLLNYGLPLLIAPGFSLWRDLSTKCFRKLYSNKIITFEFFHYCLSSNWPSLCVWERATMNFVCKKRALGILHLTYNFAPVQRRMGQKIRDWIAPRKPCLLPQIASQVSLLDAWRRQSPVVPERSSQNILTCARNANYV
jgi:hypothetical protein